MFSKALLRSRLPFVLHSFTRSYVKGANESFVNPLKILTTNKSNDYVLSHRLNITERANNRLNEIYKDSKEVLSIIVESGGCHGFQYNLKLLPDSEITALDLRECTQATPLISETPSTTSDNKDSTASSETHASDKIKSKQEQAVASPESATNTLTEHLSAATDHLEQENEFGEDEFDEDVDKLVFVLPEGSKLCIDSKSLQILNGTNLTYSTELIGSSFKIEGGNMKSSCGCGSSFDV